MKLFVRVKLTNVIRAHFFTNQSTTRIQNYSMEVYRFYNVWIFDYKQQFQRFFVVALLKF